MRHRHWLGASFALVGIFAAAGCGGSTDNFTSTGGSAGTTGGSGGATGGSGGATGGSGGATGGSGGATGGSGGACSNNECNDTTPCCWGSCMNGYCEGTGGYSGTGGYAGGGGAAGAPACGPSAKTCAEPSDCVLTASSCCICGQAELSDYTAVNSAHATECACQGPMCGCMTMDNPNLAATCASGTCKGFDVSQESFSACQTDADCKLRIGLSCCEGCVSTGYDLVAVNVNSDPALRQAICDSGPVGCPACAPVYPSDKKAACVSNHCAVVASQ